MNSNHDVVCDQDEYIKTLRPIMHPETTGQAAEKEATKTVTDLFVSLRRAVSYTLLTRFRCVYRCITKDSDADEIRRPQTERRHQEATEGTAKACFPMHVMPKEDRHSHRQRISKNRFR